MPLKECRECEAEVSTEANECPHCGAPNPTNQVSQKSRMGYGCLGLIFFVIVVYLFGSGSDSELDSGDTSRWSEAYVMCQDFVEDRLRAPGTADFPFGSREYVTDLGGDRYRVEAYVDAENAFGAQIRNDFTCTIEYQSGDRWRLEDLEITER